MAAMAAADVRSRSKPFARRNRRRCKRQVSANVSERARTLASLCHAEGRGFESHHPLKRPGREPYGCGPRAFSCALRGRAPRPLRRASPRPLGLRRDTDRGRASGLAIANSLDLVRPESNCRADSYCSRDSRVRSCDSASNAVVSMQDLTPRLQSDRTTRIRRRFARAQAVPAPGTAPPQARSRRRQASQRAGARKETSTPTPDRARSRAA